MSFFIVFCLHYAGILCNHTVTHWIYFSFQAFTEGITNQLIGCFVGSLQEPGCVLVRLYGRMTELYVNRDQEVEMFQVFHAHGCAPEIYCSFQNGICYEFVRGAVLDDELLRQPSIYRSLPRELSKLSRIYLEEVTFEQKQDENSLCFFFICIVTFKQIMGWKLTCLN